MLTKLENAYLYILRVVVLAAATLALIAVLIGLARSGTLIAHALAPNTPSAQVPGGTLQDYVNEKRPQGVEVQPQQTETPAPEAPPGIRAGVKSLAHYERTKAGGTVNEPGLTSVIMEKRSQLPDDAQAQFDSSFSSLMDQLDKSTGTALTTDQVSDLIAWHYDKVKADADSKAAEKQASQAQALQTLGFAIAGFGVFITLVFCFLIVKIERNLRLVRTEQVLPSKSA